VHRIENRVGKLVEIRIASPVSVDDALAFGVEHDALIARVSGSYVCLVDLVDATVFPPDVVAAFVATMRNEERLVRTGTLLNPSPTFGMQIHRMIKEANHPARRAFRDAAELYDWVAEVLDASERRRLAQVLEERGLPALRLSSRPPRA